jgi:hypothetical protein
MALCTGLLEEEAGNSMNWAKVAYRRMVCHRKGRPLSQCLLATFRNHSEPYHFQFPKVPRGMPAAIAGNSVPSRMTSEALTGVTAAPTSNSLPGPAMAVQKTTVKELRSSTVCNLNPQF